MIENILTLSTSHLPGPDPDIGDAKSAGFDLGIFVFVNVELDLPEWLEPIMKFAASRHCVAILFDPDVPVEERFKTYDW